MAAMSAAAARRPVLQISALQLALAAAIPLITIAVSLGGLYQRVSAQERVTAPIAAGDLARLEERTVTIQRDVAWMRDQMQKGGQP